MNRRNISNCVVEYDFFGCDQRLMNIDDEDHVSGMLDKGYRNGGLWYEDGSRVFKGWWRLVEDE